MLALFLRLHDLEREPFSPCEEGFNFILTGRPSGEVVAVCLRSNQNPLPILLAKGWRGFAGASLAADRAFAATLGAAAAVATGVAASGFIGRRGGALAALLVACAASPVLHARLVREYALLLLLAAFVMLAYGRRKRTGGAGAGAALWLALALGLHTHAVFAALPVALLVHAALGADRRRALRRLALPLLAAGLAWSPWLFALALREGNPVWHLLRSTGSYYEASHGVSALAAPLWLFTARDRISGAPSDALAAGLLVATLLAAALAGPRRGRDLALASLAPFLLVWPLFHLLERDDLVRARYFHAALPLLAAALACGALRARPRCRGIAALLLLCAVASGAGWARRDAEEEPRLVRAAVALLERIVQPGDLVVVEPPLIADHFTAFPAPFPVRTLRQRDEVGAFTDQPHFRTVEPPDALLSAASAAPRTVYWFYPYFDEARHGNPFAARLAEGAVATRHPVGEGHVTIFERADER